MDHLLVQRKPDSEDIEMGGEGWLVELAAAMKPKTQLLFRTFPSRILGLRIRFVVLFKR